MVTANVPVVIVNCIASSKDAFSKRRMERRQLQQVSTRGHQSKPR